VCGCILLRNIYYENHFNNKNYIISNVCYFYTKFQDPTWSGVRIVPILEVRTAAYVAFIGLRATTQKTAIFKVMGIYEQFYALKRTNM
jgi:hypothetical protein